MKKNMISTSTAIQKNGLLMEFMNMGMDFGLNSSLLILREFMKSQKEY